jgi:amino acid transporter
MRMDCTHASRISAAVIVIDYWSNPVPTAVWITILLLLLVALNIFAVSIFGETEFWFCSIKIIAILGLIVLGEGRLHSKQVLR